MKTASLTLTGLQHAQIELAQGSYERRADILATTREVIQIADAMDAEIAADALRLVSAICKEVEESRVEIGKPVLAVTRKINSLAKEFTTDLAAEKTRLEWLLGTYQAEEKRKADLARSEAQHRAQRLYTQTQETARNASPEDAEKAEANVLAAYAAAAAIEAHKPEGLAVRQAWKFEVTDIQALFQARPDLCVIEPNNAEIRAEIPHNQSLPGLRIWREAKASIR